MTDKLTITYMIDDLKIGGAEKLLVNLINSLAEKGHKVHLITLNNKGKLFKKLSAEIDILTTHNPLKIYSHLKNNRPDIFHSHLWRSDFIGIPLAYLAGIKKIFCTKHSVNYFRGFKLFLKPLDSLVLKLTSQIIAISEAVKNTHKQSLFYKKHNFSIIHNGIDLSPFQSVKKTNKNKEPYYLLTVANFTKAKGHLQFLDILKKLNEVDWEWHLVGTGKRKDEIYNKAFNLGIHKKIIFHGLKEDVLPFYAKADLFILPSLWEGFGLVLIEAMASETPVFASSVDGINEIIKDMENVFVISDNTHQGITKKITNILNNKKIKMKLISKAKTTAEKYSIKNTLNSYIKLYKQINI